MHETLLDYAASLKVFWFHLLTLDTVVYVVIAVASTAIFHYAPREPWDVEISWAFVSFAVVFPLTWNIGTAYRRRDDALAALAAFKSLILCLYAAHRDWDWAPKKDNAIGRDSLLPSADAHVDQVRRTLIEMVRNVRDFLLIPCVNKSRHLYTEPGAAERRLFRPKWRAHIAQIQLATNRLSLATEKMKAAGMPANEAARINQYIMMIGGQFNHLRFIKGYRTPEGIRSFARVFIFVHPLFYGPYYSHIATQSHIAFALSFSVLIGASMIGLLNVEVALEDPFNPNGMDRIRVAKLFDEMEDCLLLEHVDKEKVMMGHIDLDAMQTTAAGLIEINGIVSPD
eukprot:CAMPEP_0198335074 /NCGR_PEP_ID=MMETSP1450-20131203/20048_1 /TAXON_ID=753684 ORGANISM="Madagascaria erythrocladiodes, Strain CCMP3234" /NCGR_SAMPLE_ID=MMETSP1450 /ASSEMBLY_ACC=CAM_ASM_001115 /LENGTH=340 /DNA_ID=CAMNT_0044039705 /DNA_START=35 /DNA_END=1057 /DNA_ORIENTATION=-